MSLKPDTIRAIFTNILFVIGVILLIVGFIRATSTVANLVTFDKYPLANYEETRCDYEVIPKPVTLDQNMASESAREMENRKASCLESIDRQRQQKQVNDIVTSVSLLVSGAALVLSFRRFIVKG